MSKYTNLEEQELEAGNPHYKEEESSKQAVLLRLEEDEELEAGRPYYVLPNEEGQQQVQQLSADDELRKPFNAREEFNKLMESIRKPRSYQDNVEQTSKDKEFRESIAALSLLLNTAKGAFGGNIRREDYGGISAAANEAKAYQAMESKDVDRYEDAKHKLWMDLYNLQLKDKATERSYKQMLEQIFAKEGADARNIERRAKASKEQILLRGEVDLEKENFAQKGRVNLADKKHGHGMTLEAFKQKGRAQLETLRITLKQSGDLDKTFIDVKSPYGKGSIGLTKGETLEFFDWLLANGDITENDYTLMFESLNGTAANNMVQSKVVGYVKKYPQPLKSILSGRDKGVETPASSIGRGNPLQTRTNTTDAGKGNPLQARN